MNVPFLPSPHEEERLRVAQYDIVRQYRAAYEEAHPERWLEDTSGFESRPEWRVDPDFLSVTGIHDHPNGFWQIIGALFVLAQLVFGRIL